MNKVWRQSEKDFVRINANKITDEVGAGNLSKITGRKITVHAYRKQRQLMGLKKSPGRGICQLRSEKEVGDEEVSARENEGGCVGGVPVGEPTICESPEIQNADL